MRHIIIIVVIVAFELVNAWPAGAQSNATLTSPIRPLLPLIP